MYNRIYKHLKNNSFLFDRQFGFQINNSTDHAIFQLVNDISNSFERGKYTLGILYCGVSQGFVLGPLLFLIYVNDLHKASSILKPVTFADDTSLFLSNKDINKLFNDMIFELQKMSIWFKENKLSLN